MFIITILSGVLVCLVVAIHYELLYRMVRIIPKMGVPHRFRIILAFLGSLVTHSIEICLFAVAYYHLSQIEGLGYIAGAFDGSFQDSVYFSYMSYTTLGHGDITPYGPLRHMASLESLTGLLLITWTASFLYHEMKRSWY